MSIATTINPQELRPRIEQKLDKLSPDELAMVDGMLTQLEAHRLLDETGLLPGRIRLCDRAFAGHGR